MVAARLTIDIPYVYDMSKKDCIRETFCALQLKTEMSYL